MGAFSSISNGDDVQALALINELVNAYSERRQAIGSSAISAKVAGEDIQNHSFWSTMQDWVTNNLASYVDDQVDQTASYSFVKLTLSSWKTNSTLTSGFRKVTGAAWPTDWTNYSDAAFSYGSCAAGDIIGPWLWIDLQKAFTALKWTCSGLPSATGQTYSQDKRGFGDDAPTYDCAAAKAQCIADFNSQSWVACSNQGGYHAFSTMDRYFDTVRTRSTPHVTVSNFIGRSYQYYMIAAGINGSSTFNDIDGLGFTDGNLTLVEDNATVSTVSPIIASSVGDISTAPLAIVDIACPYSGRTYIGLYASVEAWIFRWDFTYA